MVRTRRVDVLALARAKPGDPTPRRISGRASGGGSPRIPLSITYTGGAIQSSSKPGGAIGEFYVSEPDAILSLLNDDGDRFAMDGFFLVAGTEETAAFPTTRSITVQAKHGADIVTQTYEIAVVPASTYSVPDPVEDEAVSPQFQTDQGYLKIGVGNPVGGLCVATNGEIEIAGGARLHNTAQSVTPLDGGYDLELRGRDWIIPHSYGLVTPVAGKTITDLYHITMTIASDDIETLVLTLRRDALGKHHFENPAEGIDITDGYADSITYQNIQRLSFYRTHSKPGVFVVTLRADHRTQDVPPVVVEFAVNVTL